MKIINGDNNDRIFSSEFLNYFVFVFGKGIKIIDRGDNNEFFRVNYFYFYSTLGEE